MTADSFGTAGIRAAVLDAWRAAPNRFREDANAEEDLRLGGYADRLIVELAANAADAALARGVPGTLWLFVRDGELRALNTGAPLDTAGVAALASLRASAKTTGETVGRFGVGFAAVLAVTDEPAVRSTSGGVAFSLRATLDELGRIPELAGAVRDRRGTAPTLRLPWPDDTAVAEPGFDTEVVLPLRSDVDGAALLAAAAAQAPDLLLALPGLATLRVGGQTFHREADAAGVLTVHGPDGTGRWLSSRTEGTFDAALLDTLGVEAKPGFWTCWALPVDAAGVPAPLDDDVLYAPTPTDERLSLPARLLASVPVEPTRRRVLRAPAVDAVLRAAAADYPRLLTTLAPEHRLLLVPLPGFPRSDVDALLRDEVLAALRSADWLPAAVGASLAPERAVVLPGASERLLHRLADTVPGLLAATVSGPEHERARAALGVRTLSPAELAEQLAGLRREPEWWAGLYGELLALVEQDRAVAAELGALPVPLADGRVVAGPRSVLLPSDDVAELLSTVDTSEVVGLRVAHAAAVHPLLRRLGAGDGGPAELLDLPAVRAAVERSGADAEAGLAPVGLIELVLRLVERAGGRDWLSALVLPESGGDYRRAGELVLPGSPLLEVLDPAELGPDGALGILDDTVDASRDVLLALGVLDTFPLLDEDSPTGPEHDLPDEAAWWPADDPPARLLAIRDLDLVADDGWPAALRLLAGDPDRWRALRDPDGHPAWWLSRYALLAGCEPRQWRMPEATELIGLYDPVPESGLEQRILAVIGVRDALEVSDVDDAADLLERLGDGKRAVGSGTALRAHAELADAVADGRLDPSDVDPPERVRALTGAVLDSADAAVLDVPWLLETTDPGTLVATADLTHAAELAELLDLPLAGDAAAAVDGGGDPVAWADLGAVTFACELAGLPTPQGTLLVHDALTVGGTRARWWVDAGIVHAEDTPDGLARALAWTLERWPERHTLAALLTDGDAASFLG